MTHSSVPDVQPTLPPDGDNAGSSEISLADLGSRLLAGDDVVTAINAIMPPGLQLMKATCLSVCRERAEIQMSYELDERFVNVEGLTCGGHTAQILDQTATGAASSALRPGAAGKACRDRLGGTYDKLPRLHRSPGD